MSSIDSAAYPYICLKKRNMADELIGRKEEQKILRRVLETPGAEFVAVIGRRRVGKTFLINKAFEQHIVFQVTGIQNGLMRKQLGNFRDEHQERIGQPKRVSPPTDWQEAFQWLKLYLTPLCNQDSKPVVFFDEVPWLSGKKSDFLEALGYFWNTWASRQPLVIVICGSAASWMTQNVVNNKGGLHNRLTKRIQLMPFNLAETQEYLESRGIRYGHYQVAQIYMAMGGIPHYLKEIMPGQSAIQAIDEVCFSQNGMLRDEFLRLYPSLFANAARHISVIRALGAHHQGITRQKLLETTKFSEGGALTKVLDELAYSGFITQYRPFGKKKKDLLYRLTDEYSLFYLQFIEDNANEGSNIWQAIGQTAAYRSWCGYAFENICLKHISHIKQALGIGSIVAQSSSFFKKGNNEEQGAQIDLVIDRNDHVVNLLEMKFYNETYTITKEYAAQLRRKSSVFRLATGTKKHLAWVFVTTFGVSPNTNSQELVTAEVTLEDLFMPLR